MKGLAPGDVVSYSLRAVASRLRAIRDRYLPRSETYRGSEGTARFLGSQARAPSIAAFFCGDDVGRIESSRIARSALTDRIMATVHEGGLPVLRLREPEPPFADSSRRAIAAPELVRIHVDLPQDEEALGDQLRTSTTREDLRRIRKAGFSYRVTRDPDAVREFHARHYMPLVAKQFPEDGHIGSEKKMLGDLDRGGELICADIDGEWVAGIFNHPDRPSYALGALGIRDADDSVRHKRVVSALIVRSLARAVELGRDRATLGQSLPFLGKGPLWFKVKWGGVISRGPGVGNMHMFLDLRLGAVRRMLSTNPVVHSVGDSLAASAWLEPGDEPLRVVTRDVGRFPGVSRWYVLAESDTLLAGAPQLKASERIVPVPVAKGTDEPLWLGEAISSATAG